MPRIPKRISFGKEKSIQIGSKYEVKAENSLFEVKNQNCLAGVQKHLLA